MSGLTANEALMQAHAREDAYAAMTDRLLLRLKTAKKALRKIADFSEADPVKYIQGVDAIALDALAELEGDL